MNNQLQNFARSTLKEGLAKLPDNWKTIFKRMYSPNNIDIDINDIVDIIPEDDLDWAMQQVQNSLDKQA